MPPYLSSALGSFRLLVKDYAVLLEYVYPSDSNAHVYSHRSFELLLRACTEFESLAKHAALKRDLVPAHGQPHIGDLSVIYDHLDLAGTEVGVLSWEPDTLFLTPLAGWRSTPHTLNWYRAYNSVKHNRSTNFPEATLQNVTLAVSACFLLLQRLGALPLSAALFRVDHEAFKTEWHFNGVPFTLRTPNDWPPHLRGESAA
jgi:hypothetical protein